MKNMLLGFALVACATACSTPQKNAVSDADKAAATKVECAGACEAGKSECCAEKSATCAEKAASCSEAKVCPMTGKVQG